MPNPRLLRGAATIATLGLFLWTVYRCGWFGDDAAITFRVIENALEGHGLRWNPDERVQAYTHPLWMLLVLAGTATLGEVFLAAQVLSLLCAGVGAGLLLCYRSTNAGMTLLLGAVLVSSRALVEYSTSGLENPLSHLLLSALAVFALPPPTPTSPAEPTSLRRWPLVALASGLLLTNRMDLALLVAPLLGWAALRELCHAKGSLPARAARLAAWGALGMLPFAAWTAFSVAYYGFPFPNTAYAKLGTSLPAAALREKGLAYLLLTREFDPVTFWALLLVLVAAAVVGARALLRRDWPHNSGLAVSAGIALYAIYTVRIGGDFMAGRFLAAPLWLGLAWLAALPVPALPAGLAAAGVLGLGLSLTPHPPLTRPSPFRNEWFSPTAISDEAGFYAQHTGVTGGSIRKRLLRHKWVEQAIRARIQPDRVVMFGSIGFFGMYVGTERHVLDFIALSDPLLARLPAYEDPKWRIGHFFRVLPDGYLETLRSGENRLADLQLAEYWTHLERITRGPLLSAERWRSIYLMNSGQLESLVDRERYRYPFRSTAQLAELPAPPQGETYWADMRNVLIDPKGLDLELATEPGQFRYEPCIRLWLGQCNPYLVEVYRGSLLRGRFEVKTNFGSGLEATEITLQPKTAEQGYDRLRIIPVEWPIMFGPSLGGVEWCGGDTGPDAGGL